MAVAVAECLLTGGAYVDAFHDYFSAYPDAGYGVRFFHWARQRHRDPYQSHGNGSAMRIPAIAYAFDTLEEVIAQAGRSAEVTHNHPEGVKGAQATAAAIFMARHGETKASSRRQIERTYQYDLSVRLDDLRPGYEFDESCQRTVPAALIAFLESIGFEDAVRKGDFARRGRRHTRLHHRSGR